MINQEELELRNALAHHGILGMKWGVRRFQNADGSLTSAGKRRQEVIDSSRKEGINYANKVRRQQKKGEDVASALVTAQKKAKTGQVDQSFLDNKNISQKAKDKVSATAKKELAKAQKKYDTNVNRNWQKAYNKAADYTNSTIVPELNKKYSKYDWSSLTFDSAGRGKGDAKLVAAYEKYSKEYSSRVNEAMQQSYADMFGTRPE